MYAVIKTGGHQYKVSQGDQVDVNRLDGNEGDSITFAEVVMIAGDKIAFGAPLLKGAKVEAVIKAQFKTKKVPVFKYHRRKNYKRNRSHRQQMTTIEIGKISN